MRTKASGPQQHVSCSCTNSLSKEVMSSRGGLQKSCAWASQLRSRRSQVTRRSSSDMEFSKPACHKRLLGLAVTQRSRLIHSRPLHGCGPICVSQRHPRLHGRWLGFLTVEGDARAWRCQLFLGSYQPPGCPMSSLALWLPRDAARKASSQTVSLSLPFSPFSSPKAVGFRPLRLDPLGSSAKGSGFASSKGSLLKGEVAFGCSNSLSH